MMSNRSVPALLPPELIAEIAHVIVRDDTAPRTCFPLPLMRNSFWADLVGHPVWTHTDCAKRIANCVTHGFVPRAQTCCLHSARLAFEPDEEDVHHSLLKLGQVCQRWRRAIHGYPRVWSDGGLLNVGHIGRSQTLAGPFPIELINPRPICSCVFMRCIPFLSYATRISITCTAFAENGVCVSETVLSELEAAFATDNGCVLQYLDLQLTR